MNKEQKYLDTYLPMLIKNSDIPLVCVNSKRESAVVDVELAQEAFNESIACILQMKGEERKAVQSVFDVERVFETGLDDRGVQFLRYRFDEYTAYSLVEEAGTGLRVFMGEPLVIAQLPNGFKPIPKTDPKILGVSTLLAKRRG